MKRKARQSAALRWLASALCGLALAACADESRLEESLILDTIMQGAEGPDLLASSEYAASAATIARANRNKRIVSCYARLAQAAYETPTSGQIECNTAQIADNRNGMAAGWRFYDNWQPETASQRAILQFWRRSSGTREELAIVLRGTDMTNMGDIVQDLKSQGFLAQTAQDNAISMLSTSMKLPNTGGFRRFHSGFIARANNLSPTISGALARVEDIAVENNRTLGVRITGHSLGAAAATIVSTYVADRFWDKPGTIDVEGFAFNSPMATNGDMAYMIRNAASYCRFNLHVFNNVRDVVSQVPIPARHIYSGVKITNNPPEGCRYEGQYTAHFGRQDDSEGLGGWIWNKIASANPIAFALNRHAVNQWILGVSTAHIDLADPEVAARWFPDRDIGGRNPAAQDNRRLGAAEGVFTASLRSNHSRFLSAENNGNYEVTASRTVADDWERFRFIPDDPDCARHGDHVLIATTGSWGEYFFRAEGGRLDARATASTLDERASFTLINHTSQSGCIKNGDVISLRSSRGYYLSAPQPTSNDASAITVNRLQIGNWERFTITGIHNIIARSNYNESSLNP